MPLWLSSEACCSRMKRLHNAGVLTLKSIRTLLDNIPPSASLIRLWKKAEYDRYFLEMETNHESC